MLTPASKLLLKSLVLWVFGLCVLASSSLVFQACSQRYDPPPKEERVEEPVLARVQEIETPTPTDLGYDDLEAAVSMAASAVSVSSDELDRLKSEKALLQAKLDLHERAVEDLKTAIKLKDKAVSRAEDEARQSKLRIYGWIISALAGVSAVVSIFVLTNPLVRPWINRLTMFLGGCAALCFFAAEAIPYVLPVSIAATMIGVIVGVIAWLRDNKALVQVAKGVNKIKAKYPGYKADMRETVTAAVDTHLDKLRKRLGIN